MKTAFATHGVSRPVIGGPSPSTGRFIPSNRNFEIFEDFIHYVVPISDSTDDNQGQWGATLTATSTLDHTEGNGGLLTFNSDAGDDDEMLLHTHQPFFTPSASNGKRYRFEARVAPGRIDCTYFVGFCGATGTLGDAGATLIDTSFIGFWLPETAAWTCGHGRAGEVAAVTGDTAVATEYNVLSFEYDGQDTLKFWVDGTLKATQTGMGGTFPNAIQKVMVGQRNKSTVDALMVVDYIYAYVEF